MEEEKRLYSPSYLREILDEFGFRFTKSLGQNFLIDGNIVRNIVNEAGITKDDYVLEIGPGVGTLTEELALNAKKVIAVEIDESLEPILDRTLDRFDNIEIIFQDVLDIDLNKLIEDECEGRAVKVVANLPYYITTPIIGKLIEDDLNLESITVMVQKEVADRIVGKPGTKDYSSLSVFIDFYTKPKIILDVPKTVFMPQPRIDSSVVNLELKKDLPDVDREKFFKVVKAGFAMRRKTLLNCLSMGDFAMNKQEIRNLLEEIDVDPGIRAERLGVEEFIRITDKIN